MAWDDFVDSLKFKLALENDKKKAQAIANAATHAYAADLGLTGDQMRTYAQVAASYNAAKGGMYAQDIEGRARMGAAQIATDAGKYQFIPNPFTNEMWSANTKTGTATRMFGSEPAAPGKSAFDKYNPGAAAPPQQQQQGGLLSRYYPESGVTIADITDPYNRAATFNQRREQEQSPFNRFLRRISKPLSYYEPAF